MELSSSEVREYTKRLMLSRMRVLMNHGFFGLLLLHMKLCLGDGYPTAWTNGESVWFNPQFIDELSDDELDYVFMHEIMHVALKHCTRGKGFEHERFNIACDIAVNSHILAENHMNEKSITIRCNGGVQMHQLPDGTEGIKYTAEEIYARLPVMRENDDILPGAEIEIGKGVGWDEHGEFPGEDEENGGLEDLWNERIAAAVESVLIRDPSNSRGTVPAFALRMVKELKEPQVDWRTVLNEFVQEEICDYSFFPPDKRFDSSPFFLPEFNEAEDLVKDILFMIDTSGSMSDDMITAAYSEVKGAIEQFGGKLRGWLGFFDAAVVPPQEFEDEESMKVIKAYGGGGTSFHVVFKYVQEKMKENPPASIIILTDGYAPFPAEKEAMGIPVLWVLNNRNFHPKWGKVAILSDTQKE